MSTHYISMHLGEKMADVCQGPHRELSVWRNAWHRVFRAVRIYVRLYSTRQRLAAAGGALNDVWRRRASLFDCAPVNDARKPRDPRRWRPINKNCAIVGLSLDVCRYCRISASFYIAVTCRSTSTLYISIFVVVQPYKFIRTD